MSDPPERETDTAKQDALRERLLGLLPSSDRNRTRAVLERSDAASFQRLTEIITQERQKREKSNAAFLLLLLLGILTGICGLPALLVWPVVSSLFFLIFAVQIYLPMRLENAAMEILLHTEAPEGIGLLLDNIHYGNGTLHTRMRATLIRLLPRLTPKLFLNLSPKRRDALYGLLNYTGRDTLPELRLALLAALQQTGDPTCLGCIYLLATGQATTPNARTVRDAAAVCLDHLLAHLDFGPLRDLPHYIETAYTQAEGNGDFDLTLYFTAMLTVRKLLPRLTPSNYRELLSERCRSKLYSLARLRVLRPLFKGEAYSPGKRGLQLEIIRTAERLGDTCAIGSFQAFLQSSFASADLTLHAAVSQALLTLEPLAEQEKLSRTLLRGAPAPNAHPDELLRAATPNASTTDPAELLRATTAQTGLNSGDSE